MSTKSFIINLPIITGDQDRRRLRKSFSFGCNLQNAVMGGGWDCVLKMRATPEWQAARAMPKGSERTKAFRDLRVRFRLNEYDFHADVAKHRKASGRGHLLGINEGQKLASRAWISVERHLYNGGSPRFISSRRGLHSIEGKTNRTGIIWKADQQCVTVCKRVYRVRVDKRDDWLTRALQDPTDPTKPRKVKYCRIVREMRKGKQSYQGWMFARLLAFSNGDLQALYDRSDGFYRRQLVLTTKEKPAGRVDDPDLAEKMKAEVEGIFLWAFEGLQRLVANNFKFTESQRTRDNREAVKRDNNNVFDFLESEGYIRLKADCTISSKDLYEIYRMWCEENNLIPLKRRSFSESVIANQNKYNLEYCNKITNAAGRRVWGFFGIEAIAKPNINGFSDVSERTYVPEEWR